MTNLNLMNEANYACDHRVRASERQCGHRDQG
jgi:hypothetical protein